MLARHIHGPAAGVDDPLISYAGTSTAIGNARYLYADARGSVVFSSTSTGSAPLVNSYDPYGVPGSANTGRFQYTGQIWLAEAGLYYYKARMYSPTLGRFLQTDPIGYEDNVNLYAYVGNDPVNGVDPSGMYECDTDEACQATDRAISQLESARDTHERNPELGSRISSAAQHIQALLDDLGTEGDGNDIRISDTDLAGRVQGNFSYDPESGLSQINLDVDEINGNRQGRVGEVLGHELQHYRQRFENLTGMEGEVGPFIVTYVIGVVPGGTLRSEYSARRYVARSLRPHCNIGGVFCTTAVDAAIRNEWMVR